MMMTVLRKSTLRPLASVRCPSSRIWSRMLNTSGWAFSISSSSTTRVALAAHRLGQLAALLEADVAGRRADQAADTLWRSMNSHMSILISASSLPNMNSASALASSRLADAGGAQEDERADRALGILEAGARAADGLGDRCRWPRPGR